jgi:hypothetical protein
LSPASPQETSLIIALWRCGGRRGLIAETFSEGAGYVGPLTANQSRAAIDGRHDRVRFFWELAAEGGPVVARHRLRQYRRRADDERRRRRHIAVVLSGYPKLHNDLPAIDCG